MKVPPLRRFASSPLKGGRTLWPGKAGSTGALDGFTRSGTESCFLLLKSGAHV
jgi:hypothetical protein